MPTVPDIPLRTLENYVDRIEAIRRDAESDGMGTLTYLLAMAKLEAEDVVLRSKNEPPRGAGPDEVWLPVLGIVQRQERD